jgi:hypothetical protein
MTFMEQMEALERLHLLIQRKGTGTPEKLAERFGVSLGTINNWIKTLRHKQLPVAYCRERQTYYYEYDVDVFLFVVKAKEDLRRIQGGESFYTFFSPMQNFCIDTSDLCTKLKNTEEQNDAGGFRFWGLDTEGDAENPALPYF